MTPQALTINTPKALPHIGLAVRVCYVPATNARSSGWRATIKDLTDKVAAFVPFDHSEANGEGEKRAAVKALENWITGGNRFAPQHRPQSLTLTYTGHIDGELLFFFNYGRQEAGN